MGAAHDAAADGMLDPVGLKIDDDFDGADGEAHRQQQQEEGERSLRPAGQRIERREQRNGGQQHAAIADGLDDPAGKGQRDQRADGRADQRQAKRALADAHGGLDIGQARENAAHGKGINEKRPEHFDLGRQVNAESHGRNYS
ncbi:hypothetical protein FQZ97_1052400 [compost metagenome]